MDARNDKYRDFHGVTAWHEAGYTGKRGLSASGEDFSADPKGHAGQTLDVFKEFAPDREIIHISMSGKVPDNYERMAAEIAEKHVDTMFMSFDIDSYTAERYDHIFEPISGFCSMFNSIGNDAGDGFSTGTRSEYIHGVGAISVDTLGNIVPEGFSSVSEYVDFTAVDHYYVQRTVTEGTSFSTPAVCGMAALVNDLFIEKTGAPLSSEAMYRFLKDNSVDIKAPGHDTRTGWGYIVLPPPGAVDIDRYAEVRQVETVKGKTGRGLCEYARAQLNKPYWYGTYGQTATKALYTAKKAQYPGYYTASDFQSQYGRKVHDCAGLIKGYLMSGGADCEPIYDAALDKSADGFYGIASEKGGIYSLPEVPGVLVHMKDHVGVYMGGGTVIEARGHAWGVVETPLIGRGWQSWSKCPFIDYTDEENSGAEEDGEMRYNTIDEAPDWARDTLEKLVGLGALKGDGEGLDLSYDMIRMLVINDRMGLYGK